MEYYAKQPKEQLQEQIKRLTHLRDTLTQTIQQAQTIRHFLKGQKRHTPRGAYPKEYDARYFWAIEQKLTYKIIKLNKEINQLQTILTQKQQEEG
jgi:prefoldin subunit 5